MPEVSEQIFSSSLPHGTVWTMSTVTGDATPTLRQCREILALSQLEFATQLGVPLDTYRTWDSGRRPARDTILARARALAGQCHPHTPLSLDTLALILDVHVRTLRVAARDGRLRVIYNTVAFGRPVPRATLDAGEQFRREFYKVCYRWDRRSVRPSVRPRVPPDYPDRVRSTRLALGCTLADFASRVGAANKAVIYQWESRKRIPSPLFWRKVVRLERRAC